MRPIEEWVERVTLKGVSDINIKPTMMTIHTAVSSSQALYDNGFGPGGTHSHFYNPETGRLKQYQEITKKSFADLDGNDFCVSVEHWDGYPNNAPGFWENGSDVPPLTESQIENDAILFAHLVINYDVPNRIATPDNLTGLGWHRLGIRGNFPEYNPKDMKTWTGKQSGVSFSRSFGKVCPGDRRIDQVEEIFDLAQNYINGKVPEEKQQETPRLKENPKVATMSNPAIGRVSSEYGWRPRISASIPAMLHAGIDIANKTGTPVYAAFAGTVERSGWNVVAGRSGIGVLVRNPDGERQYYGHLSRSHVKVGQRVKMGQSIGEMGATGNVTGPHLHFEVWDNRKNPMNPRIAFRHHGLTPGQHPPAKAPKKTSDKPKKTKPSKSSDKRVLRSYYHRALDGNPGYYTYKALQEFLRDRGLYDRAVDGRIGYYTWLGLQKYLTVDNFYTRVVDGEPGYYTWLAVQKWLKKAGRYHRVVDGKPGHYTYKALQEFLSHKRWVTIK